MKKVKVNFVDFWPNFVKTDNYFFHLLSQKYQVEIDEKDPDLLFFSVDYQKQRNRDHYVNHRCKKIFYTGENVRPNFDFPGSIEYPNYSIGKCDYAFTFDFSPDTRNYRLPLWVLFVNWFDVPHCENRDQSYLIPLSDLLERKNNSKDKFCNFLFSNTSGERLNILNTVSSYKSVDCAGRYMNNTGYTIQGRGDQKYKVDFIKDYKFTIAAENSSSPGYTTEKIIHPLSVGSIPIYWGSDVVSQDFNKKAFINVKDYDNLGDFLSEVKRIDSDESVYQQYINEPIFADNKIPTCFLPESVLQFFEEKIIC